MTTTTRWTRTINRIQTELDDQRHTLTITRCTDCNSAWTTNLGGDPISWLGEWAADRHSGHRLTTARLT